MTEREALENLVRAWEALPVGHYSPHVIERWMKEHLKPAVDNARKVLDSN